jgi:hypothetical protein
MIVKNAFFVYRTLRGITLLSYRVTNSNELKVTNRLANGEAKILLLSPLRLRSGQALDERETPIPRKLYIERQNNRLAR